MFYSLFKNSDKHAWWSQELVDSAHILTSASNHFGIPSEVMSHVMTHNHSGCLISTTVCSPMQLINSHPIMSQSTNMMCCWNDNRRYVNVWNQIWGLFYAINRCRLCWTIPGPRVLSKCFRSRAFDHIFLAKWDCAFYTNCSGNILIELLHYHVRTVVPLYQDL